MHLRFVKVKKNCKIMPLKAYGRHEYKWFTDHPTKCQTYQTCCFVFEAILSKPVPIHSCSTEKTIYYQGSSMLLVWWVDIESSTL